jgi:hypothetical protein
MTKGSDTNSAHMHVGISFIPTFCQKETQKGNVKIVISQFLVGMSGVAIAG